MTDRGYHARLRAAAAAAAASSTRPLSSAETNVRFASDPSASKLSKETRDAARLEALRSVEETLARSRRSSTSPPGASSAPQPSVARAGSFNAAGTSSTSSAAREQPRRGGLERSVSDATNVSSRRDAIPPAAYYPRSSLFDVDIDSGTSSESSNGTAGDGDDGESPSSASSSDGKENAGPAGADADPEDAAWTPPPPPDSPDVEDDVEDDKRGNSAEAPATPDGGTERGGGGGGGGGGGAGYRGVSEWMDAVVAQAKAVRQATGMMNGGMNGAGKPSAQTLASAAASGDSLRAAESIAAPRGVASPSTSNASKPRSCANPTHPDGVTDEEVEVMTVERLVALCKSRGELIKELSEELEGARGAHEETAAALARSNAREETLEEELRRSAERCSEVEAGRRSARAALAEMASQNARLVSAFSAKKEEVRSLKSEVAEARKGVDDDNADIAAKLLAAQSEAASLREAAARKDADVARAEAAAESERASSRASSRELEKLRDRLAQTERSRRRLDAELAATRARTDDEIAIAVRVARKELDVERAQFQTERSRWEAERRRITGELSAAREATAKAAQDAAAARAEARAAPRDNTGASASDAHGHQWRSGSSTASTDPSAPYRDPLRDPFRRQTDGSNAASAADAKAVSPLRNPKSWSKTKTPTKQKHSSSTAKSPGPDATPRQRAEHHKVKGNNEFHAKRYEAALAQYSAGLALDFSDDAFRAILHANRAAALQAMRQYCEAVMDCCASHLLDPKYLRALQRRADAYLSMGDWPNAANDLEALTPHMGAECATKLAEARRKVKKGTTCDHYAVLGVGHEASGSEIKQAYRQLALKMHPDKAPKPELRSAAEAMFKHVAQAYATLSDATQRKRYDSTVVMSRFRRSGGY